MSSSYYPTESAPTDVRRERAKMLSIGNINKIADGKISGITFIDKAISSTLTNIKRKCKSHFGLDLKISPTNMNPANMEAIYKWLGDHCSKANDMITRLNDTTDQTRFLTNTSFFFKADKCTYVVVRIGQDYRDSLLSNPARILLSDERFQDSDIYMYIFGKKTYKYFAEVNQILSNREHNTLRIYKITGDKESSRSDVAFKSLFQDTDRRELSTIFMEDGVIESITDHIDKYIANKNLYTGRGIIYKTGILLYGEPGTGKTSLIKALASKYGYDLILLDMSTFANIGLDTFIHAVNIDDHKYIIALEDIDCIIADRENKDIDKDEKKVVNKLLQLLDSNSSPNEVIFIASTNHIELLDEALLREGRFDLQVYIGGIKEKKVIEMCKSFNLTDDQIKDILQYYEDTDLDIKTEPVRQSQLQSIILKHSGMNIRGEISENDEKEESNSNQKPDVHQAADYREE